MRLNLSLLRRGARVTSTANCSLKSHTFLPRRRRNHGSPKFDYESPIIAWSEEVEWAIHNSKPVVALESTIYTHGFPYPESLALARDLEAIVRKQGAIPATIGIISGKAKIGLSEEELGIITESSTNPKTMKVSRKDLPYILGMVS